MEYYLLCIVLIIASVWDLVRFKIPNALIVCGLLVGVVTSVVYGGWGQLLEVGVGMVLVLLIFLPAWLFFGMGAGDVKLLVVMASFVGFSLTVSVGFFAILLSAVCFLFLLRPTRILAMFRDYFSLLFYRIPLLSEKKKKQKMPFAVIISISFLGHLWLPGGW